RLVKNWPSRSCSTPTILPPARTHETRSTPFPVCSRDSGNASTLRIIRTMQTFFNGKVQVMSLLLTDQPAARKDILARLVSPGGELTVLTDGTVPIRHLNYVELREGKPRGNHYHKLRH